MNIGWGRATSAALAITTLIGGCASGGAPGGAAAASCVGPTLSASAASVAAGGSLTVAGRWFITECRDVVVRGQARVPAPPIASVSLLLRTASGQAFGVGTAHPDSTGSFRITITVPDGAAAGPATLRADDLPGTPVELVIG